METEEAMIKGRGLVTTHNNGFAACLTMVWNCDELTVVLHGVHSVELKQQKG